MPQPVKFRSDFFDLSQRLQATTTVVASPALAAETIIASLTIADDLIIQKGVIVSGWAAYTVGTSGTTVQFRIRQTNVSGTVVANTGAMSGSQHGAGILSADDVNGFDTTPVTLPGGIYVLTMQVANGAAASTVSAVFLSAFII